MSQVIGRGREAEVAALLAPLRDGAEVTSGVWLTGIQIGHDRWTVTLATSPTVTAASAQTRLLFQPLGRQSADAQQHVLGQTASFSVVASAATGPLLVGQNQVLRAVQANDRGGFFARGDKEAAVEAPALAAWVPPIVAALWLVVGLGLLWLALQHYKRWGAWLLAAGLLMAAARTRQSVPWTPLHADDHAWLEAAIGLNNPDVVGAGQRLFAGYGPSWGLLQQWTAPLLGADLEALGRWSTILGSLAAVLAGLAAARLTGSVWSGLLPGLAVAWLPVAVRVGRSESTLVVAQVLVAAGLILGQGRTAMEQVATAAILLLLATGHPLGPVFAGGLLLAIWALRQSRSPEHLGAGPSVQVVYPALPSPNAAKPSGISWLYRVDWVSLVPFGVAVVAGTGWLYAQQTALLGQRLTATDQILPLPGAPWQFWLWLDAGWGSWALVALAALGAASWPGQPRWRRASLLMALVVTATGGLLVIACLTDAARYQAPLAPLLAVCMATLWVRRPLEQPRPFWVNLGALVVVWQLLGTPAGLQQMDAQAQSWQHLRRELAQTTGQLQFLIPERTGQHRGHVVLDAPRGLLWAGGPQATVRQVPDFLQDCRDGIQQPPAWLYLSAACAVQPAPGQQRVCQELESLMDHTQPVRSALIRPLPPLLPEGLRGEFHTFMADSVDFRLARARCP